MAHIMCSAGELCDSASLCKACRSNARLLFLSLSGFGLLELMFVKQAHVILLR